jgi:RNase P/RNase MRP subunit POP5
VIYHPFISLNPNPKITKYSDIQKHAIVKRRKHIKQLLATLPFISLNPNPKISKYSDFQKHVIVIVKREKTHKTVASYSTNL